MAIDIRMPALTPTMESGTLTEWLAKEGDRVSKGTVIAEVETDKAIMEIESPASGILGSIVIAAGSDDVPVDTVIGKLLDSAEESDDVVCSDTTDDAIVATGIEAPPALSTPTDEAVIDGGTQQTNDILERTRVSPIARRMAAKADIDLSKIKGSGPHGRIVKLDVERAAKVQASTGDPVSEVPNEKIRLSNMRKAIARRLSLSKQTAPHFYLTMDVILDKLLEQRREMNAALADQNSKLSVNDFIIGAAALALDAVPAANAQYSEDAIIRFSRADVSVAVATDGGLVAPVIRGADKKSLSEISSEMKDLAARAQEGTLTREEIQGGTFSISNLGMYGVREFSAVINPPQGAILAVGSAELRAIVREGSVVPATTMTCTLSCDHRVIDGAIAAEFLNTCKRFLEEPETITAMG